MANVTIIPPTPQVQTISPAGGGQAQGAAPTPQPGSIVSGIITGKDGNGNFLLRTDQGTLTLKSSTPLTYNSDVVVQIGNTGNTTSARIISVNGESFADYAAPEPETSDTLTQSFQTQAATPDTQSAQSATPIRGIIVSAPTVEQAISNTQAGNDNSQPVSGTNVLIRIVVAPQATVQQASSSISPQQTGAPVGNNQANAPAVQAQAQIQQLVEDTTPSNVAKLVASQPANIQQNSPAPPAAAGNPQPTAQQELANASEQPETFSSPGAQNAPSNILYAAYLKQTGGNLNVANSSTAGSNTSSTASAAPSTAQATSPSQTSSATSSASANGSTTTTQTAPNTLQGQVVAANADASTVTLQTSLGAITIKAYPTTTGALLPGTNVSVEVPADSVLLSVFSQAPLTQAFLSSTPAPLNELASSWQTLNELASSWQTLNDIASSISPAAFNSLLSRLPQIGQNFISSVTGYIGALAEGNLRKLLGDDTVDSLRQNGRLDLLQKFGSEVSELNTTFNAPAERQTPGWQALFLPFVYQEEIQQARLYVKRDSSKKGNKNATPTNDMRFVIEVDLSELGPLQMDGLLRSKQQGLAFDLIVRSHHSFSDEDKVEISNIYNDAAELTGFKGSISFQVTHHFPIKPLDELLTHDTQNITV